MPSSRLVARYHLARQLVDAPRDLRVAAEDLGLDLVDVVLEAGDHGGVAVDDPVQDRVQHRLGPEAQQVGVALHAAADRGQVRAWLWRTVSTKFEPTNTWISPNSTSSTSSR